MTAANDGGPAFPGEQGMSIRDYFAALAMQALLARGQDAEIAVDAYVVADDMIEKCAKGASDGEVHQLR